MSLHREDYTAAAGDVEEYFGDTVIYSDPKVSAIAVRANVHPERTSRRKNDDGGWDLVRVRRIYLFDHSSPTIDDPREDATIEAEGTKYSVESIAKRPGGRTQIDLRRASRAEIARRGRRM